MSEEKQKEIKTLKGWEESGKNWDDFCKPGAVSYTHLTLPTIA